jgi:hypothetical protein
MQKPYASKCGQERPSSCVKKLFSKEALKCRNIKYLNAGRDCIKMQKQHTEKKNILISFSSGYILCPKINWYYLHCFQAQKK